MSGLAERVAGAPITWGVCEVPDWGHQLAPDRVLREMARIGLRATELGPEGFLPGRGVAETLQPYGLELVGGFLPVVLHRIELLEEALAQARDRADQLAEAGAGVLVLACTVPERGYDRSTELGREEWAMLADGIDRVIDLAGERGLALGVHPHYGTVIQTPPQIERLLAASPASLCLDTGHVMVGGGDPLRVAREAGRRVAHVHLKDVDAALAERVRGGAISYREAVRQGMYRPLGSGDVDVRGVILALEAANYRGWYVLEQDTVLAASPAEGAGPVQDAEQSFDFLRSLAAELDAGGQDSGQEGRGTRAAHGATS